MKQAAEHLRKCQTTSVIDLELVHELQLEFDGIFESADILFDRADGVQRRVKCGAFPTPRRAGYQHDAIGTIDVVLKSFQVFAAEAKLRQG